MHGLSLRPCPILAELISNSARIGLWECAPSAPLTRGSRETLRIRDCFTQGSTHPHHTHACVHFSATPASKASAEFQRKLGTRSQNYSPLKNGPRSLCATPGSKRTFSEARGLSKGSGQLLPALVIDTHHLGQGAGTLSCPRSRAHRKSHGCVCVCAHVYFGLA